MSSRRRGSTHASSRLGRAVPHNDDICKHKIGECWSLAKQSVEMSYMSSIICSQDSRNQVWNEAYNPQLSTRPLGNRLKPAKAVPIKRGNLGAYTFILDRHLDGWNSWICCLQLSIGTHHATGKPIDETKKWWLPASCRTYLPGLRVPCL